MQSNSQPGCTFRFLCNPCANSNNNLQLQVTEADVTVSIIQAVISLWQDQLYEQMKQAESNVASSQLLIAFHNRFSVAVTYSRRRFEVQISLKH